MKIRSISRRLNLKRCSLYALAMLLALNVLLGMLPLTGISGVLAAGTQTDALPPDTPLLTPGITYALTADTPVTQAYRLSKTGTAPASYTISGNVRLTRGALNNGVFSGAMFTIENGCTLTLDGVILDGTGDGVTNPLIALQNGGTLIMTNGARIINNHNDSGNGGGISVSGDGNEISGALVYDCSATNGGGVYLAPGAELTLTGSSRICNNSGSCGGIYLANGTADTDITTLNLGKGTDASDKADVVILGNTGTALVSSDLFRAGNRTAVTVNNGSTGVVNISDDVTPIASADRKYDTQPIYFTSSAGKTVEQSATSPYAFTFTDSNALTKKVQILADDELVQEDSKKDCAVIPKGQFTLPQSCEFTLTMLPAPYCVVSDVKLKNGGNAPASVTPTPVDTYKITVDNDKEITPHFTEEYISKTVKNTDESISVTGDRIYRDATVSETRLLNSAIPSTVVSDQADILYAGVVTLNSNDSSHQSYKETVDLTVALGEEYKGKSVQVQTIDNTKTPIEKKKTGGTFEPAGTKGLDNTTGDLVISKIDLPYAFVVYLAPSTDNEAVLKTSESDNGTGYATLKEAVTAANSNSGSGPFTIVLQRDIKIDSSIGITKDITIIGGEGAPLFTMRRANGYYGNMFDISSGKRLRLINATLDGGSDNGVVATEALIKCSGKLEMCGTTTLQNNDNTAATGGNGGGIYLNGGDVYASPYQPDTHTTITPYALITNCNATNGGGIYSASGNIGSGIVVKGCSAEENGGGVYAKDDKTCISSATITENTGATAGVYAPGGLSVYGSPVISGNISSDDKQNNLTLGADKVITITAPLGADAKIGIKSPNEISKTIAKNSANASNIKDYCNRFFPDTATNVKIASDTAGSAISLQNNSDNTVYANVISSVASTGHGTISPAGTVRATGTQSYVITPDSGYKIDKVTRWLKNGSKVDVPRGELNIADYAGHYSLTVDSSKDNYIEASFTKIDTAQHSIKVTTTGGTCKNKDNNSASVANGGTVNVKDGASNHFTFTPTDDTYELTSLKLGSTDIPFELTPDGLSYSAAVNDVSANGELKADFTKVYVERGATNPLAPTESGTTAFASVTGAKVRNDAVLKVSQIPGTNEIYKSLSDALPTGTELVKLYDVSVESAGNPEKPFKDTLTLKLLVGDSYAGKKVSVYHIKDNDEVDSTSYKDIVVGTDGYVTLTGVTSFSPYGIIAAKFNTPSGNPDGTDGTGGTNNGGSNTQSLTSTNDTDGKGEGKTGDNSAPLLVAIIMGVSLLVLVITSISIARKKKAEKTDAAKPQNDNRGEKHR